MKRPHVSKVLTGLLILYLVIFFVYELPEIRYDTLLSIAGVIIFYLYFEKAHQDNYSYALFLVAIFLHNANLYDYKPLGIDFDHYMHFIGAAAAAICADRFFFKEKWTKFTRIMVLVVFAMGLGSIVEISEWLMPAFFGYGQAPFFFGSGDPNPWQNTIVDMIMNLLGALTMSLILVLPRAKKPK